MAPWTRVAPAADLPPGSRRVVEVDGVRVAVFSLSDGYHAIEDICTHDGGELAGGEADDACVTCPRHGARFDLRSGAVLAPPAWEPVAVLPTRVEDGWVEVRDDRWD